MDKLKTIRENPAIKKPLISQWFYLKLAEWTGLEPATPGVTGRYSNQLNYHSKTCTTYHLPLTTYHLPNLVGADGFEPPTFAL